MNKKSVINKYVTLFLIPFMVTFGVYIQIFGEVGPGGGFQAGAIIVSAFIAYDLSVGNISKFICVDILAKMASLGVLLYFTTGLYSLFKNKNFLDYSALPVEKNQVLGILLVEVGVGVTVFAILLLLYLEVRDAH